MTSRAPLVVIGGGQAAASMILKLRSLGDERSIVLFSDEQHAPYQRPNLSKKYLRGELELSDLMVRPSEWYPAHAVELKLGQRVKAIERAEKRIRLADGSTQDYSDLVLATGGEPRRLPAAIGGELSGVYTLRDVADADKLAPLFTAGRRLTIIGGGYIGLEAAAVGAQLGLEVTLVEMAERILQRVAAPETSDYFRVLHQGHGVRILESTQLICMTGDAGRVSQVELSQAGHPETETLAADFVIVGAGINPRSELAEAAGLEVNGGIVVDAACRSSDPSILAAGDCASFIWNGQRTRLESVQNATDQGEAVASTLAGHETDYQPVPWFWSDQYDVKLQIAGLNRGYSDSVIRPGTRDQAISVWYYKDERLLAVDAMNDARSFMTAKRLLQKGISPTRNLVADPQSDLKALLQA
ncbi:NAD(P)/FAD-dependent oxidoreductase [Denitrobaculum tricleocarpae]|uniref:Pyridine nucleotide-disulfide oxidoreductase n=1 Tax=Denitrobaculum tricleocarpae TaxID=2591009 RepID=A0A545T3Z2_9PROT|nr:FAD-dependent oxidoreductase [Denitrobaculum tricleocarpae]TQV71915.1 pyridine nucleotide-disulfide oxidoreductase [Denitrobaculum tricleocarpae]